MFILRIYAQDKQNFNRKQDIFQTVFVFGSEFLDFGLKTN